MPSSVWGRARELRDAAFRVSTRVTDGWHRDDGHEQLVAVPTVVTASREAAEAGAEVSAELTLDRGETRALEVLQTLMVERDVAAVTSPSAAPVKAEVRDRHLAQLMDNHAAATGRTDAPHFLPDSLDQLTPQAQREAVVAAGPHAAASFATRSRAMMLLVELHLFQPWPEGYPWNAGVRKRSLAEVAEAMPGLSPGDAGAVETELGAALRQMQRKQVSWGRVAAVGVVGLGLGAATMGLAAPLIGASIGAAAGLSGAAATSAGLATIGGGSLAAGGFGVAGGTALLSGVGALAGAGAAAGGARVTRWASPGDIALEALKADVVTRLVILGQDHDEEKAKRVVLALQARLDDVVAGIAQLGERIHQLTEANNALDEQNRALIEANQQLKDELEAHRAQALLAEAALEVAIDRIPIADTPPVESGDS